ncbi:hypothetical protein HanRHA438_Chr10g0453691 [Helianthus annuus]|nr:hypothetical protein HanRHA438_Chr10g0453691 [Helianthus annuus]
MGSINIYNAQALKTPQAPLHSPTHHSPTHQAPSHPTPVQQPPLKPPNSDDSVLYNSLFKTLPFPIPINKITNSEFFLRLSCVICLEINWVFHLVAQSNPW